MMSTVRNFDVIVIGAGVEGSATAYQLTKLTREKRIALVEQVGLDLIWCGCILADLVYTVECIDILTVIYANACHIKMCPHLMPIQCASVRWGLESGSVSRPHLLFKLHRNNDFVYCAGTWLIKFEETWRSHPRSSSRSFAVFSHPRRFLVTPSSWRPHLLTPEEYQGFRPFHSPLSPSHRFYRWVGRSNNDYVRSLFFCDPVDAFSSYAVAFPTSRGSVSCARIRGHMLTHEPGSKPPLQTGMCIGLDCPFHVDARMCFGPECASNQIECGQV